MKSTITKIITVVVLISTLAVGLVVSSSAFAYDTMAGHLDTPKYGHVYEDENYYIESFGTIYELINGSNIISETVPVGNSLSWSQYAIMDNLDWYFSYSERQEFYGEQSMNGIELLVITNDSTQAIVERGMVFEPWSAYSWAFNSGIKIAYKNGHFRYCFSPSFASTYGTATDGVGDYSLVFVVYYGNAYPNGNINSGNVDYDELLREYEYLMEEHKRLSFDNDELQFKYNELEELYDNIVNSEDYQNLGYYITALEEYKKDLETYKQKYEEAKEGMENSNAILNFFSGIYDTIHGVISDIFGIEVMGFSVGAVIGVVVICAVLFFIIKLFI